MELLERYLKGDPKVAIRAFKTLKPTLLELMDIEATATAFADTLEGAVLDNRLTRATKGINGIISRIVDEAGETERRTGCQKWLVL